MGCAESCSAKDFEATVNTVYVKYSGLLSGPPTTMGEATIKLSLDNIEKEDTVITTRLNDIAPSDRNKFLMMSDRISKEAVGKLTKRSKKQSLIFDADDLLRKVKRQLE